MYERIPYSERLTDSVRPPLLQFLVGSFLRRASNELSAKVEVRTAGILENRQRLSTNGPSWRSIITSNSKFTTLQSELLSIFKNVSPSNFKKFFSFALN